ncbi:MAG: hypothetical protein ABR992_11965 [Solirubrobacteraceae bacterium]
MRLAAALWVVVVGWSLVLGASAFAAEPLFKPVSGQTITGTGGASSLLSGQHDEVACEKDAFTGVVSNALLIGGIVIHYLNCTWRQGQPASGCAASSVGAPEGLILTKTLHAILGLVLPDSGSGVGLLFLPVNGVTFTTFATAQNTDKEDCFEESAATGNFAGLVTPIGISSTTLKVIIALTGGRSQEIKDIDLTHGLGLVLPKFVVGSTTALVEQTANFTFSVPTEVT